MAKEIEKSILSVLGAITEREIGKSLEKEDYAKAAVLSVIHGIEKEALRELEKEE